MINTYIMEYFTNMIFKLVALYRMDNKGKEQKKFSSSIFENILNIPKIKKSLKQGKDMKVDGFIKNKCCKIAGIAYDFIDNSLTI